MNFLKKNYTLRRYSEPKYVQGYSSIPYEDLTLPMDIQTLEDTIQTEEDGRKSVQKLKVFCDYEILAEELALRDMDGEPLTGENYRALMERIDTYLSEFDRHGTDHVNVDLEE